MKKKIFGSIAVLAIAIMTAFNVNINSQGSGLSDISLENVEALANEYETDYCNQVCRANCCAIIYFYTGTVVYHYRCPSPPW